MDVHFPMCMASEAIVQAQFPIFTNCLASSQEVGYEFHENFRIFWAVLTER